MTINDAVKAMYVRVFEIISEHNSNLSEQVTPQTPGFINSDNFLIALKVMGGTTEDRLRKLSWEEILECLPDFNGIKPKQLAKDIAQVFRGTDKPEKSYDSPRPVSAKKADRMLLPELVESFDPEDHTNAVGKRLRDISRGGKFIVYSAGRTVDRGVTLKLLQELKDGYPAVEVHEGKRVYALGVLPDNYVDENPMYRNRPLRPDGSCDQLGRSWQGVPKIVRQFVAFALGHKDGPCTFGDRDKAWALFDLVLQEGALTILRNRYPKVAVDFDEAEKLGKLPLLQIALAPPKQENPSNPFEGGQKVEWNRRRPPNPGAQSRNLHSPSQNVPNYYNNDGRGWTIPYSGDAPGHQG